MRIPFLLATSLCVSLMQTEAWVSVESPVRSMGTSKSLLLSSKEQSINQAKPQSSADPPPAFLTQSFSNTECDNVNCPPSLNILLRSIQKLSTSSGSDIRGRFVDHARLGSISAVAHEIGRISSGSVPPLTPLAAHCFGHGFADMLLEDSNNNDSTITIVMGRDPRPHGMRLTDAFCRGAESRDPGRIRVVYTGVATTPACAAFCRMADASVMVTASHLPVDRNGLKFFTKQGGFTKSQVQELGVRAMECASDWYSKGMLPPASGENAVMCSGWVDWMPQYADSLKQAVIEQVNQGDQPLKGLKIVLNSGNGSGGFFESVLKDLGADVSGSVHNIPDGDFPNGVPNPEYTPMYEETVKACEAANADLGIMLDTDADRCGFAVPRTSTDDGVRADYEPLNRNRLIALLGVVLSRESPGCGVVTDSVTSEGLATFLEDNLGLKHVRYLKGYANVINKAKDLTTSGQLDAKLAIETSGHCAMQENGYFDDGTYTAVRVVSLLAREQGSNSLLDLIADMEELDEISELRMATKDGSLDTMQQVFDFCALEMERLCESTEDPATENWEIDTDNLEGIRIRTGNNQFLMLRKSLHDPIISLQIEARSKDEARETMVQPLLRVFEPKAQISDALDMSKLKEY